jgi:hypothetical protein
VASRELHVIGSDEQTFAWFSWDPEDQSAKQWQGRQVLYAGETLQAQSSDLVDLTVSGYLLGTP